MVDKTTTGKCGDRFSQCGRPCFASGRVAECLLSTTIGKSLNPLETGHPLLPPGMTCLSRLSAHYCESRPRDNDSMFSRTSISTFLAKSPYALRQVLFGTAYLL